MNNQYLFNDENSTLQIDSARYQNYSSILQRAEIQDRGEASQQEEDAVSQQPFNSVSHNFAVKVIGGDNNLSKNKGRRTKSSLVHPNQMMCIRNSILENEVFPVIADENLDPDDLNKKINYGITDNISKMDAKMVKVVQSRMKIDAMKKKQIQYQNGIQKQIDEKQAKQAKSRNVFIDHRIKHCKDRAKKWQERKENHDNFMLEKEILKQIMQDEYLVNQQDYWQKKDSANSQSQQFFDVVQQSLNKSTQLFQRNNVNTSFQAPKPSKEQFRPETANTFSSNFNPNSGSRQQQRHSKFSKENEKSELIKSLNLIGDRIGTTRSQTAGGAPQQIQQSNKKLLSSSFYNNGQNQVRQINGASQMKRESSFSNNCQYEPPSYVLKNNLVQSNSFYKDHSFLENQSKSIHKVNNEHYTQDIQAKSINKINLENISASNLQPNLLSEIKIQRDFAIADPQTRSIIHDSFTQPTAKKNLSLDQNALVSDNANRQATPSSFIQTKPHFGSQFKTPSMSTYNQITPVSQNQAATTTATKFQSISPANGSRFSFKKQDQKLSYDKRRYQCLNKIYQSKINQLNQDEVFTEKMRKQNLQNLVRRKINNNFPGNYKLKINFSLVEKMDEQDDNVNNEASQSNLLETLYQQNSLNINNQQLNHNQWNTQSHQISRSRQNYQNQQNKFQNNSFNLYQHNDPSSDEDGEDVIRYIKNL